MCEKNYLMSQK